MLSLQKIEKKIQWTLQINSNPGLKVIQFFPAELNWARTLPSLLTFFFTKSCSQVEQGQTLIWTCVAKCTDCWGKRCPNLTQPQFKNEKISIKCAQNRRCTSSMFENHYTRFEYKYNPPFHLTAIPLRSLWSRIFSKIIPNRCGSVDCYTICGLNASNTLPLRFYYASATLLLRSHYDKEDLATLSLRWWRCSCDLATTLEMELRFRCAFVSFYL